MKNEIAIWLLSSANKLRAGSKDALNIEDLLNSFEIQIRLVASESRSGALARSKDGGWFVIIRGKRSQLNWTVTDRFTAAHELAHFLLIKNWGYSPTISDKKNYYDCEELCNRFASRLLLDYKEVEAAAVLSPRICLGLVRDLATRYQVSNEVAARALIETHPNIAICAFAKTSLGWQKRLWGLSSFGTTISRFGFKQVKSNSIYEEVITWSRCLLDKHCMSVELDFATESVDSGGAFNQMVMSNSFKKVETSTNRNKTEDTQAKSNEVSWSGRAELSAVMIKKTPTDV